MDPPGSVLSIRPYNPRVRDDLKPPEDPGTGSVAFTRSRDGNYGIYLMDADGTELVTVSVGVAPRDLGPSWRPVGRAGSNDLHISSLTGQA
ncbi:MAG: hypothetical protein M3353_04190, partial [Actinomycetota bacterium]|nr:hypothetical protein [Actinomycetota bacterium]